MINKKSRICLYIKEEGGKNRVKLAKNWLNAYKKKGQMGPKRRQMVMFFGPSYCLYVNLLHHFVCVCVCVRVRVPQRVCVS